ncbi:hypothetical protein FRB90_002691 [Tulasnella sp. 427]|nr:hypothetical protein FRB90_002691 [Tulasnella sp. 427]
MSGAFDLPDDLDDYLLHATSNGRAALKRKRVIESDDEGEGVRPGLRSPPIPAATNKAEAEEDDLTYPDSPPRVGNQVLPVADLPQDFTGVPKDGMEYLFMVRRDAAALPTFTKVSIGHPFATPTWDVQQKSSSPPPIHASPDPPNSAIPSQRWRQTFEKRFMALRQTIAAAEDSSDSKPIVEIPHAKDRDGWWKFINGDLKLGALPFERPGESLDATDIEHSTSPPAQKMNLDEICVDDAIEESDDETPQVPGSSRHDDTGVVVQMTGIIDDDQQSAATLPSPSAGTSSTAPGSYQPSAGSDSVLQPCPAYKPKPPNALIIAQLDNRATLLLLMFFGYWLNTRLEKNPCLHNGTSKQPVLCDNDAKWIFSLLARLDRELTSEQISTLRTLARACIELLVGSLSGKRKGKEVEGASLGDGRAGCWMVIAAVSKGWGQLDLWDEAVAAITAVCA